MPLSVLLLLSVFVNLWQYRLIQCHHKANPGVVEADTVRSPVGLKRKASKISADGRVENLYREIEHLGQISDALLLEPGYVQHDAPTQHRRRVPAIVR